MADETPEQIRERVLKEELAKGSDPRVAEGRSKAAELRARAGLPIDPQQAWRAKLEKEGGAPSATTEASAEAEAPAEADEAPAEAAEAPVEEAAEAPEEEVAPQERPTAVATAERPVRGPVPAGVEVERESTEIAAAPAFAPVPAPAREVAFEPEIGEIVELEFQEMGELAGIKLADARLPAWLIAAFVALVAAAVFYLLVFSGPGAAEQATGCRVEADRKIVCGSIGGEQPPPSEEAAP